MAKSRNNGRQAGGKRPPNTPRATPGPQRTPRAGGSTPTAGRQSVAAARKASTSRTQPVVLIVACVVIAAVIIFGLVLYNKNTAVQGDGYGESTASTASVDGGSIIVSGPPPTAGADGPIVLDVYEDPLCPICGQFEQQFGQQMAQAVDTGRITVNYHLLTFLDPQSASQTYSTRAAAAAMCVAQEAGSGNGVFEKFHTAMFASGTQPEEGGVTDLSDAQLAQLATDNGAGAAADCITSKAMVAAAQAGNTSGQDTLRAATGGRVATPTVLRDGQPVSTDVNWLTTMLAAS